MKAKNGRINELNDELLDEWSIEWKGKKEWENTSQKQIIRKKCRHETWMGKLIDLEWNN